MDSLTWATDALKEHQHTLAFVAASALVYQFVIRPLNRDVILPLCAALRAIVETLAVATSQAKDAARDSLATSANLKQTRCGRAA